jgi:hypothetical protein
LKHIKTASAMSEAVLFVKNIENYLFYLACLFIQVI